MSGSEHWTPSLKPPGWYEVTWDDFCGCRVGGRHLETCHYYDPLPNDVPPIGSKEWYKSKGNSE